MSDFLWRKGLRIYLDVRCEVEAGECAAIVLKIVRTHPLGVTTYDYLRVSRELEITFGDLKLNFPVVSVSFFAFLLFLSKFRVLLIARLLRSSFWSGKIGSTSSKV